MVVSFRNSLAKIGVPKPNSSIPPYPSGFHSAPSSLRAGLRAMNSPRPSEWEESSEGEYGNENWTEECQGVTNDGQYWYFSSNNKNKRGIYKFTLNMKQIGFFSVDFTGCKHIGGIDYYDGTIYAALEKPPKILMVENNFQSYSQSAIMGNGGGDPPQGASLSWCAINPWNGYLYSSSFGDMRVLLGYVFGTPVTRVYAYDPSNAFVLASSLELGQPVYRVQGGCFSKNGHLLLSSDDHLNPGIRCYSALNGAFLGSAPIQVGGYGGEVEGITIWDNLIFDGIPAQVHVIHLDNDWYNKDDVGFKHYTVPLSEYL